MPDMRSTSIPARAGHTDIRRNNLEIVLRHLWAVGTDSRAAIAARAGLTRATVSSLVAELIGLGLVNETGTTSGRGQGRPGTQLALTGQHVLAIGTEINVDYLAVLVVDLANRQVFQKRQPFDARRAGAEGSLRALAEACEAALKALPGMLHGRPRIVAGLGVAVPGLVDAIHGTVSYAPNLEWHDVPVVASLAGHLRQRVGTITVGNEANRAALAEYRVGSHAGLSHLVYVTGDVGIGGGLIVQGRPLLGSRGYGGEVGHMTLDPDGPLCGCGRRGCWETFVGINALLSAAGLDPVVESDSRYAAGGSPQEMLAHLVARAEARDSRTLAALARLGDYVGIGAANVGNIINPDAIVLGGYFTAIAPWIIPTARASLRARLLAPGPDGCELAVSGLGFMAAARGGATDIVDRVISNPHRLLSAATEMA